MQDQARSFNRDRAIALIVLAAYCAAWILINRKPLFDPLLQTDDARTHLIAFLQFRDNPALAGDPIIAEMTAMAPSGFYWIHRSIASLTGVLVAAKIVQGLCLLLPFLAILLAARRRPESLPALVLALFFVLHSVDHVSNIASGIQRSFDFPCTFLWIAGAIANWRAMRVAAILLGALTYPSVMALLLAAEGFLVLFSVIRDRRSIQRSHVIRETVIIAALLVACISLLAPYMIRTRSTAGHVVTLEEARDDPAFHAGGRIEALPFKNPARRTLAAAAKPFEITWQRLRPLPLRQIQFAIATAVFLIAFFLVATRRVNVPIIALALAAGVIVTATAARLLAFRLYLPFRYVDLGMRLVLIVVLAETIPRLKTRRWSSSFANVAVAMAASIVILGPGIDGHLHANRRYRRHSDLWDYLRSTPTDARIACHPADCSDVPLFAARAATGGVDTLQPWFTESWERQKTWEQDTLEALYATDLAAVSDYCRDYRVTHFLLRPSRYGADFRHRSRSFEPFTTIARDILKDVEKDDLVLGTAIERDAQFQDGDYVVIPCPGSSNEQ